MKFCKLWILSLFLALAFQSILVLRKTRIAIASGVLLDQTISQKWKAKRCMTGVIITGGGKGVGRGKDFGAGEPDVNPAGAVTAPTVCSLFSN